MRVKLLMTALLALSLPVGAADAQLPPGSVMTVGNAHSHSVSLPLRSMPVCPTAPKSPLPDVELRLPPLLFDFAGTNLAEISGSPCSLSEFASERQRCCRPSLLCSGGQCCANSLR
jgi:hypothetical protein